ncbi:TAXI family TRAP transporter solute-binding subunit [uncultured Ilyobacter sp.]|uniref:TAXI family TRAP transporter solute-binding subunit n=1 Tax=uncultured Ilyobacter sp. TaxID=544433 RepID=UPI0029C68F57|nr:TAXI family TRAP transporter solute-binding subunit [uncultured Ilyobacter sp.]
MRNKSFILVVFVLFLVMVMTGCSGDKKESAESKKTENVFVTIATGGSSGAYFALGGAISNQLNQKIEGVNSSVQSTGASAVNATLLGTEKVELAFAMNDVVSYAYTGTEVFKEKGKVENLRGVAALYPNFVQLITVEKTGIKEVSDLKGKRVGVGAPGSGTEVNARQILKAYGITYDDIKADYLSYAEAIEQMKNGAVDAAFLTSGLPNSTIMDLATTQDVKIIPIRKDAVEKLAEEYPFYASEVIPAGTYDNKEDVETAAVQTLLVTRADLSDDLVYNITKTIFENLDALKETHSAANSIKLESVRKGMPIPLHPGAEKYFNEHK